MDKFTRNGLLYDYYGGLLSRRQQEVTRYYYEDNLSLSEIAEEFGITRQGVHDALHAAEKALESYEQKLGLLEKQLAREAAAEKIERALAAASVGAEVADAVRTQLDVITEQ